MSAIKVLPTPKLKTPTKRGKPNKVGVNHIHKTRDGYYQITRRVRGHTKYYYSSRSLDNVLIVLAHLLTHNWEMPGELPVPPKWNKGKPRNRTRYTGIQYVQKIPNGKYILQRKGEHYGTYQTIIDAVKDKIFWESIGWDYDNME